MNAHGSLTLLRRALWLDALASGSLGVALLLFGGLLAPLVQLPAALLVEAGVVLVPFALFVGYLASRAHPNRTAVWVVIAVNALWVIDSVVLLFTGWVSPNALGYAFVLGQAAVVAGFAQLQYLGLSRPADRAHAS